ncbi:DUF1266 domain-containing protein [Olivibacter sp. SDN3]|nr:DUF1266 domain-containing protein [Olivibacter sp. SDN3]QNL51994.1 DUF1266 domain-containing protein [Olivibacter sp. SDN3]
MTDRPSLQNLPNRRQNPAKKENIAQILDRMDSGRSSALYFLGIAALFMGFMLFFMFKGQARVDISLAGGLLLGILLCLGIILVNLVRESSRGMREQERYYVIGEVKALTAVQQRALRLVLVDMYYFGFWIRTLEYYPCEVRMKGKTFKPKCFAIEGRETYRKSLDRDWGIVSTEQYRQLVRQLFEGMHSKLFAVDMDYCVNIDDYLSRSLPEADRDDIKQQNDSFISRLAGLINKPVTYVTDCFNEQGDKPKALIWGFDLWRVIPMSRDAFMAGYIKEEEAWTNILKASDLVYHLFDSFEDFFDNFRLGNAYWSNDLETTRLRQQMWELYQQKCNWAERDLPWQREGAPQYAQEMQTGFANYIKSKNKKYSEPIGFRRNGD